MQSMDETYRLMFRGEVLDDQHPAVVRKRLSEALKLTHAQAEKLFAGGSVVIKQRADVKTAARYQAIFKRAGARLRVLPVEADMAAPQQVAAPTARPRDPADAAPGVALTAAPGGLPRPPIDAPDYSLAELGTNMAEPRAAPVSNLEVDFELAEVGEPIPNLKRETAVTVDLDAVNFEVAEVGSDMGQRRVDEAVTVPDISHLQLVD